MQRKLSALSVYWPRFPGQLQRTLELPVVARAGAWRGFADKAGADGADDGRRGGGRLSRPAAGGPGRSFGAPGSATDIDQGKKAVDRHAESVKARFRTAVKKDPDPEVPGQFATDWWRDPGHKVAYRFRIEDSQKAKAKEEQKEGSSSDRPTVPYTSYSGLRFPTLETAENFDYHKDRGIDRIVERSYPIKVPGHRRLDPYLREYIHFLHNLDPARFTLARIAQRYRLREKTVALVVKEWGTNRYLTHSGLTRLKDRHVTREDVILAKKEEQYAKWVGWDQLGDQDDPESDDEAIGEYKGWRATTDWVRRQCVEVEMMSAFPMMEKRNPMPKRVDVDLVVDSREHHKIINWIDPTDKVVF